MPSSRRSRRRPYTSAPRELDLGRARGGRSSLTRAGEEWIVQQIRESAKTYVCPGCGNQIPAGQAHVAAWRAETVLGARDGLENRRHWHAACWRIGH
ncbi:hypothetical protein [Rarobacter incanus]|uniref:ATP/GTP-binding protein n=1 Tax=Rarobacter incanus TaxID=153494 RepID=A0A542SRJ3_9MICO|nr:hypothetical protein [Rarobacter incanus]TQK77223.1 hypothetical protein FB389_1940 [Rarobacter incanus]